MDFVFERKERPIMAVFVPFNILPACFGGGARVLNEYRALSEHYDVKIICISNYEGDPPIIMEKSLSDYLTIINITITGDFHNLLISEEAKAGGHLHDILLIDNFHLLPNLVELAKNLAKEADIFVSSHPYFLNLLDPFCRNKTLIYEAQDVEWDLKKTYFKTANKYLDVIKQAEQTICERADIITVVSEQDKKRLVELYCADEAKIVLLPNSTESLKRKHKSIARSYSENAVFTGSWHFPNEEAVKFIMTEVAPKTKNIQYKIIGNINLAFKQNEIPENVKFLGILNDAEKDEVYATADIALNPMFSGSGSNLKVPEYCIHGIPLVTTGFGLRGFEKLENTVFIAGKDDFSTIVDKVSRMDSHLIELKTMQAKIVTESEYGWGMAIKPLLMRLNIKL